MSHDYKAVQWSPFKRRFDLWMTGGIALYLGVFIVVSTLSQPEGQSFTPIQMIMRATGSLAFLLLTFILCIGPLSRLSPRFLPLLYNRRHLGVTTFLIALIHAGLSILWYHGFSEVNALVSVLSSNPRYDSIGGFPFESLGLAALIILFVMAATSHDFWNANLGPGLWKTIHMGVYLAYALLIAHVALGVIQFEKHPLYTSLLCISALTVCGLHLLTGIVPWLSRSGPSDGGWLVVGPALDMPDGRARIITPPNGERIAVFRDGPRISAISNVCRHQGGPLGEGRIVDGCVTCPWHGFQYRMEDGRSPAPYTEMIATYQTKIEGGIVYVHAEPLVPGTPVEPSHIGDSK